jgi:hypothetical protein
LHREIANGYPVLFSFGPLWKTGDTNPEGSGHIAVIRGFTEKGDVIINDPWGDVTDPYGFLAPGDNDSARKGIYYNNDGMARYYGLGTGDNCVLREDELKKIMRDSGSSNPWFHQTLVIHYPHFWSFPVRNGAGKLRLTPDLNESAPEDMEKYQNEKIQKMLQNESLIEAGFPFSELGAWHDGLHITGSKTTPVYAMGPGRLLAARIAIPQDKARESKDKTSACFALVGHTAVIKEPEANAAQGKAHEFFSYYMHLKPIKENSNYTFCRNSPGKNGLSHLSDAKAVVHLDNGTGKIVYLTGQINGRTYTNMADPRQDLEIPVRDFDEYYRAQLFVCMRDSAGDLPPEDRREIRITVFTQVSALSCSERKSLTLKLYRHGEKMNGSPGDPFPYYRKRNGKDHDFFVIPRVNAGEAHGECIKRLKLYNNQVIARHKGLSDDNFTFLPEDSTCTGILARNIAKSIPVFRRTKCVPYNFDTYGQDEGLIRFLAHNYNLARDILSGVTIDRLFIYGDKEKQSRLSEIEGLENLYQKAVIAFRRRIIYEAIGKFVNFPLKWLFKPHNGEDGTRSSKEIGARWGNKSNDELAEVISEFDYDAIQFYETYNGVPYYWNGKAYADIVKDLKDPKAKWTDYTDTKRPGDGAGIDCSGLIAYCLNSVKTAELDGEMFFLSREISGNSITLGKTCARLIPLTITNEKNTLIQSGDLLYKQYDDERHRHIAICSNDWDYFNKATKDMNAYVTVREKDSKYFKIIHNHNGQGIPCLSRNGNQPITVSGYFSKTLWGPFMHWTNTILNNGTANSDVTASRVYLWR